MAENVVQCSCSVRGVVHRPSDTICVYNTAGSGTDRTEKFSLSQLRKNRESSGESSDTGNSDIVPMFECLHPVQISFRCEKLKMC